jgi:hypothetical protein
LTKLFEKKMMTMRKMCMLALLSPLCYASVDPSTVSVGKLRSDADAAMVGGDVDKSIKLMTMVRDSVV